MEDRHKNGIPLEKPIVTFMKKAGIKNYKHNDFRPDKYPFDHHLIVDGEIPNYLLSECTNPKATTYMPDNIMLEKLDYFQRRDPLHLLIWVLIISFANFSSFIMQQIKKLGIILIELGFHADNTNYFKVVYSLFKTKLYYIVKSLITKSSAKQPILLPKLSNQLSNCNIIHTIHNHNNVAPDNTLNNLYQHTDLIPDSIIDDKEVVSRVEEYLIDHYKG